MKLMVAGATSTIEELLRDWDASRHLGAMVTPNTGNSLARVGNWGVTWCIDNAAFNAQKFDPGKFLSLVCKAADAPSRPVFVVVPDVVANHAATVALFDKWLPRLRPFDLPLAFVAQDGLSDLEDEIPWPDIEAVFIGGGDEFKEDMTIHVAEACRRHGKWCHLGRVNGRSRLRLALHNDVDSVDGSSLSRFPKTWIPKFIKDCVALEQEADRLDDLADRLELLTRED